MYVYSCLNQEVSNYRVCQKIFYYLSILIYFYFDTLLFIY